MNLLITNKSLGPVKHNFKKNPEQIVRKRLQNDINESHWPRPDSFGSPQDNYRSQSTTASKTSYKKWISSSAKMFNFQMIAILVFCAKQTLFASSASHLLSLTCEECGHCTLQFSIQFLSPSKMQRSSFQKPEISLLISARCFFLSVTSRSSKSSNNKEDLPWNVKFVGKVSDYLPNITEHGTTTLSRIVAYKRSYN